LDLKSAKDERVEIAPEEKEFPEGTMTFTSTIRSEASKCESQPNPYVAFIELRQSIPSDVGLIEPLADQLMRFISRYRNGDNSEIELALSEALANAMIHGNQEDPSKRVGVICRCGTDGEVSVSVQDEGSGFEIDIVPDPTHPDNRLGRTGRGLYLMKALMDEVCFEQRGAVVHMRKRLPLRPGAERETK
jgi:serine/threonine-protein kinase RsbW